MKHTVYIGIGSNLNDRITNCNLAVDKISEIGRIISVSKWYETSALTLHPDDKQPDYINGAVKIDTYLEPFELLYKLKDIEASMGRSRKRKKWSPRVIDLDILLYDDIVLDDKELKIPHPEIQKRLFVLRPLCDIGPAVEHPVFKTSIEEIERAYLKM